jgi:hypothetical protein
MLSNLLKIVTPDAIATAIRENPVIIKMSLQKFDTYTAFGQALETSQQVFLSNNLDKLSEFFKTETGKQSLQNLIQRFEAHTQQ